MGRVSGPPLSDSDRLFIQKQHIFFTASAPLSAAGHVNLSPKSATEFRVVSPNVVCYLDQTGSGSETAAHLLENGRITVMFIAFDGPPKILRMYGHGKLILPSEFDKPQYRNHVDLFDGLLPGQPSYSPGLRCIVTIELSRISTSCGYSIPFYDYVKERLTLHEYAEDKGEEGMRKYRLLKNSFSIDGLPSIATILSGEKPTGVVYEGGYMFGAYGGNWLQQVWTSWAMRVQYDWRSGALLRDAGMLACGASLAAAVALLWTPRGSRNNR